MSFKHNLATDTIVELDYDTKEDALEQLARRLCRKEKLKKHKPIIEEMMSREEASTTFIGQGVAIPQSEAKLSGKEYSIIVGRSIEGINYDAARNAKVHITILVVTVPNFDEDKQLEVLSEVSTFFKNDAVQQLLLNDDVDTVSEIIKSVSNENPEEEDEEEDKDKKKMKKEPLISAATSLARDVNAKAILIFSDTKSDNEFLKYIKTRRQVIIITSNKTRFDENGFKYDLIQSPYIKNGGIGQVKVGILLAMSRNILKKNDTVVCVSSISGNDNFDTAVVVNIEKEFEFFFSETRKLLPPDVTPEVLERVLGIASEIGLEGREGKSIGTIFVLGDTNQVNKQISQLIINPFRGYSESERNILDPGLEETIKEFASIDGAFVITGDGVVLTAGSYLRPQIVEDDNGEELESGLGARHAAAAGITANTNAIAIAISESTGQVTLFKNGAIALTLSKSSSISN